MFAVCVGLVQFPIICSLQYSININTVKVDPHSDLLHICIVKPKNCEITLPPPLLPPPPPLQHELPSRFSLCPKQNLSKTFFNSTEKPDDLIFTSCFFVSRKFIIVIMFIRIIRPTPSAAAKIPRFLLFVSFPFTGTALLAVHKRCKTKNKYHKIQITTKVSKTRVNLIISNFLACFHDQVAILDPGNLACKQALAGWAQRVRDYLWLYIAQWFKQQILKQFTMLTMVLNETCVGHL